MVISRIRSVAFAIAGIRHMLILELNARIHLLATVAVIIAGIIYGLTPIKWIALALAIGLVWIAETFNTAIEKLCDYACGKEYNPEIKTIKDVSAGAVLIAACLSVIIGFLVFILSIRADEKVFMVNTTVVI